LPITAPRLTMASMTTSIRPRPRTLALAALALAAGLGAAACAPPAGVPAAPAPAAAGRSLLRVDVGATVRQVGLSTAGRVAAVLAGDRAVRVDTSTGATTDLGAAGAGARVDLSGDGARTFWSSAGTLNVAEATGTRVLAGGVARWAAAGDGSTVVVAGTAVLDPADTDGATSLYLLDVSSGTARFVRPAPATAFTLSVSDNGGVVVVAAEAAPDPACQLACPQGVADVLDVATGSWASHPGARAGSEVSGDGSTLWLEREHCRYFDDCADSLTTVDRATGVETVVEGPDGASFGPRWLSADGHRGVYRYAARGMAAFDALVQLAAADGSSGATVAVEASGPGDYGWALFGQAAPQGLSDDGTRVLLRQPNGAGSDLRLGRADGTTVFVADVAGHEPAAGDAAAALSGDGTTVAVPAGTWLTVESDR